MPILDPDRLSTLLAPWALVALNAAIKGSAILLAAALVVRALRNSSAAARHLVWTLAVTGVLALPILGATLPAWRLPVLPPEPTRAGEPAVALAVSTNDAVSQVALAPRVIASTSPRIRTVVPVVAVVSAAPSIASETGLVTALTVDSVGDSLRRWLPLLWAAGVLVVLSRRIAASIAILELRRNAVRVDQRRWISLAEQSAGELRLTRPITILQSERATMPMTWGIVSPVVLLPSEADGWTRARLRAVLLHELAHVKRLDALTQLVAQTAAALLWFNPLIWLAARRMRAEREHACDDRVLLAGTHASSYANDLLDIVRRFGSEEQLAWTTLAMARRSQLEGRLLAILDPQPSRSSMSALGGSLSAMAALCLILPLAAMRPVQTVEARVVSWRPPVAEMRPAPAVVSSATTSPAATLPISHAASISLGASNAPPEATALVPAALARIARAADDICTSGKGSHNHSNWSSSRDGHLKQWTVHWSGDGCSFDLQAEGEIGFNDDFSDITSVSSGGYVDISLRKGGDLTRLVIRPGADGSLQRVYTVNGTNREWNAEGRAWLAELLIGLDRATAFAVDKRFPKLLARGGSKAVLDEAELMQSDYARAIYLMRLVDSTKLDAATLRRVIQIDGSQLSSDYEKARVLMAIAHVSPLDDESSRVAFLGAANGLKSDYEHARVLMVLAGKTGLSREVAKGLLASASTMSSDYEKSRVLLAMSEAHQVDPSDGPAYLQAVNSIESDYERSRSLLALLSSAKPDRSTLPLMFSAARKFRSDYELARVLIAIATSYPLTEAERNELIKVADGMKSDYEKGRVMTALVKSGRSTRDTTGSAMRGDAPTGPQLIINQALYDAMNSTFTQAELLMRNGRAGKVLDDKTLYNRLAWLTTRLDSLLDGVQSQRNALDTTLTTRMAALTATTDSLLKLLNTNYRFAATALNDHELYDQLNKSITALNKILAEMTKGPMKNSSRVRSARPR
ncbi:MAG: M56 family metallopeptidase [Gemmatimonadota bacterium]|nr:M56 family metallopeptidase [Gemmatimonadota bacterium]